MTKKLTITIDDDVYEGLPEAEEWAEATTCDVADEPR
jgi:hypothetical protein